MPNDQRTKTQGGLLARLARATQSLGGHGESEQVRWTAGGLPIGTPKNPPELQTMLFPPPRIWWEKVGNVWDWVNVRGEVQLCLRRTAGTKHTG